MPTPTSLLHMLQECKNRKQRFADKAPRYTGTNADSLALYFNTGIEDILQAATELEEDGMVSITSTTNTRGRVPTRTIIIELM